MLFGDARGSHLAWKVDARASSTEHDISVVDASTGDVLWRANMVSFADVTGHGLAWQYADSSQPPPGTFRQQMRTFPVANAKRLFGNNAHVFADVNDDNHAKLGAYPNGDEIPASNPGTRTWAYHVQANTASSSRNCTPKFVCTWNSTQANSWKPNLRQNATQVYYYINNFHNHLLAPPIGFTEAAGNFELAQLDPPRPGRRPGAGTHRRRRQHRRRVPRRGPRRQREHGHPARRTLADDADVPVRSQHTVEPQPGLERR